MNWLTHARKSLQEHPWWRYIETGGERRSDLISPICLLLLGLIGVFFIYSAQSYHGGTSWKMQIAWLVLGAGVYTVVSLVHYRIYLEIAHLIYGLSILLLLPLTAQSLIYDLHSWLPSIPAFDLPMVKTRFGATRWLDFGFAVVQPSELAKIGVLLMCSSILVRQEGASRQGQIKVLLKIAAAISLPLLLIFLQPDLGSSLVFPPMVAALLYVSQLPQRYFTIAGLAFVSLLALVAWDIYRYQDFMRAQGLSFSTERGAYEEQSWVPLRDYQRNRILTFAAPHIIDPEGTGDAWNLKQSLIAVASGGLLGKGLGEGTQAKLGYLPKTVAPNDFIFSVIAEEAGFVGGLIVLSLFFVLIVNSLRIASLARDRLGLLLGTGVSVIFLIHVFVNTGMTIGLMPITGLPLPFLSYGGSFVLSCCILQGLVQSVYRNRRDFARSGA